MQLKLQWIKNILWFTSILSFFPLSSLKAHPSLFFKENEINLIKQNLLIPTQREQISKKPQNLYLSAIIYVDETHWTLWLNQNPVHATDIVPIHGYHIEKVTPHMAVFSYLLPPFLPRMFTLPVHHMFLVSENKIIKINE